MTGAGAGAAAGADTPLDLGGVISSTSVYSISSAHAAGSYLGRQAFSKAMAPPCMHSGTVTGTTMQIFNSVGALYAKERPCTRQCSCVAQHAHP